jgi:3-isopropylmalate/(R)-2-methylmalate dehydratase small subunit
MYATEGYRLAIDLQAQTVTTPSGSVYEFEVDAFRKDCLLKGLDDIGLTLEQSPAIRAFEEKWRAASPWLFDVIK